MSETFNNNSPQQMGNNNVQNINYYNNIIKEKPPAKVLTAQMAEGTELIGRDEELKELKELVEKKDKVVLVNGIGGIGKTELCRRYFRDHYDNYKHLGWINYQSSIKDSFVFQFNLPGITNRTDIDVYEKFKAIVSYLNALGKNCLLIIDNMDNLEDENISLIKQLPFKVVVSSRMRINGLDMYNLGLLPLEDCMELFYSHYEGDRDDEILTDIVELAGRHTLTVELLAKTASNSAKKNK